MLVCRKCQEINLNYVSRCKKCGIELKRNYLTSKYNKIFGKQKQEIQPISDQFWTCDLCQTDNATSSYKCRGCGIYHKNSFQPDVWKCDLCEVANDSKTDKCAGCGIYKLKKN